MATLILFLSVVIKSASLLNSEKSGAFVSTDIDIISQAKNNIEKSPSNIGTIIANTFTHPLDNEKSPRSGNPLSALPLTLNIAMGRKSIGGRASASSHKRTFIPSMSMSSKVNHPHQGKPDFSVRSVVNEIEIDFDDYVTSATDDQRSKFLTNSDRVNRRNFLSKLAAACLSTGAVATSAASPAFAVDTSASDTTSSLFNRVGKGYEYNFQPPTGFKQSNKPLKTHLDEINFSLEGVRGYQYGITVDPVRIESLKQFGTPEQVATRVVNAEAVRDGVTDVKLIGTPTEDPESGIYAIDYISEGKRGIKHFITRIAVSKGNLFVLTAQVKEVDFTEYEKEMEETVKTFHVV